MDREGFLPQKCCVLHLENNKDNNRAFGGSGTNVLIANLPSQEHRI